MGLAALEFQPPAVHPWDESYDGRAPPLPTSAAFGQLHIAFHGLAQLVKHAHVLGSMRYMDVIRFRCVVIMFLMHL